MRIAISTATSHVGRRVAERLLDEGWANLVLLTRSPEKLKDLHLRGAQVVSGDLFDIDYVKRATEGVDVLLWVPPWPTVSLTPEDDIRQLSRSAAAAIEANTIGRVVHLSDIAAYRGERTGPIVGVHDAEKILDQTAAAVTHLRIGYLMEYFLVSTTSIRESDAIFLPVSPYAKAPMVAACDVAEIAAGLVTDDTWRGIDRRIFDLQGPADVSFAEAATIIAKALDRPVRLMTVSPETAREKMIASGFSNAYADLLIEWYSAIDTGWYAPALPRSPASETRTTFETFTRDVLVPAVRALEPVGHV